MRRLLRSPRVSNPLVSVIISEEFVKQAFWFLCALIVFGFTTGALHSVKGQVVSPTPDPFTIQLTSTPNGAFGSFASDMSANGRFVVFTSNGNVATENPNNADGNREIFIADYAQRRIFQITNTKSVPNPSPSPSPTPTPSASPTPSPSPTPTPAPTPSDLTLVKIQIDNLAPMISLSPPLVNGQRIYTIVFGSNAPNPGNFDGTEGNLATDANTEIWIYRMPAVTDVDLTQGAEIPKVDLAAGVFTRITDTPASRLPTAGSATFLPFYADDNREASISDDGRIIAFISTRNLVPGVGNADANPELFFYDVAGVSFSQGTNTQDAVAGVGFTFQSNPSLSSDGSIVSFYSSANLTGSNDDGNGEVFLGTFSGGALSNLRQVTRTLINPTQPQNVNVLSPGRRLSRDGSYIAFESLAVDPKANSTNNSLFLATFVYTVATDTFAMVGARPTFIDLTRFPAFTDYNGTLTPSSLVFCSRLNFRADGTVPELANNAEGLNPLFAPQLFLTQLPASDSNTFIRLTNVPFPTLVSMRAMTSNSRNRMAFAFGGVDLGGGNLDGSQEVYYLLTPIITNVSAEPLTFETGASLMPVATATPVPSPTPSPTPTPSPSPDVALGLAPAELSIIRANVSLAPSTASIPQSAISTKLQPRSPALPVELNGVSVSVNGAGAGLYFVGNQEKQINFVMPQSLASGLGTVAVNINNTSTNIDTAFRGLVQIVGGQPDIGTTANGPGGIAMAVNVTNPNQRLDPPFNVTSTDESGNTVPTVIELTLTGVHGALPSEITITIGSTTINGTAILAVKSLEDMPGVDIINFTLPEALAGAGDVPIIVTFTRTNEATTTSRSAATAPTIHIN